jgi:chromosome segregation ATPase
MEDLKTLISGIDYKIRKLLDDKRKLEQDIQQLEADKKELNKIVLEQSQEVNNLKEQVKTLKLGETIKNSLDTTDVKLKINNLVRKIDKCVGMITKTEQE